LGGNLYLPANWQRMTSASPGLGPVAIERNDHVWGKKPQLR
jgi:hypothetical protein